MKMLVYSIGDEERPIFLQYAKPLGIELTMTTARPGMDTMHMAQNMDCINVLSDTVITPEMWDSYHALGIRCAVTRTIGIEHMNQSYASSLGIQIMNITYSPSSVADYAIMMMLMVLRQVKPIMQRYVGQDFTVAGLRGRELPNMTVGIIGAGRIGTTVIAHLQGFGCKVLYWNRTPRPELSTIAEYCTPETLLAQSDIVSIHLASTPETAHFMNAHRFSQMKPGAILINTARGLLVDNEALITALESGQLSAAGLDVFDGDRSIYYSDYKNRYTESHAMAILNAMPNVLMLPHIAYYTDQAVEDMVRNSLSVSSEYWYRSE